MVSYNQEVIAALSPYGSMVLLDPEFGSGQVITGNILAGTCGLLVAVEATGYVDLDMDRMNRLLPGWSVVKIRRMGACWIKLFLYIHPDSLHASRLEHFVRKVTEDYRPHDIPRFLELCS